MCIMSRQHCSSTKRHYLKLTEVSSLHVRRYNLCQLGFHILPPTALLRQCSKWRHTYRRQTECCNFMRRSVLFLCKEHFATRRSQWYAPLKRWGHLRISNRKWGVPQIANFKENGLAGSSLSLGHLVYLTKLHLMFLGVGGTLRTLCTYLHWTPLCLSLANGNELR